MYEHLLSLDDIFAGTPTVGTNKPIIFHIRNVATDVTLNFKGSGFYMQRHMLVRGV